MKTNIKSLLVSFTVIILITSSTWSQESTPSSTTEISFLNPPMDCRPHTYWWWPGNAVTAEEITWELE